MKLAKALSVTLDELTSKVRPKTTLVRAKDIPKKSKAGGAIVQHKLLRTQFMEWKWITLS